MSREEIQNEYNKICAEVGHMTFRVLDINNQQKQLAEEVKTLDAKIAAHRKRKLELETALRDLETGKVEAEVKEHLDELKKAPEVLRSALEGSQE